MKSENRKAAQKPKNFFCLSESQWEFYRDQGYLLLENFISKVQCERMIEEANRLVSLPESDSNNKTVFSTTSHAHEKTHFFLNSGDKIRLFYEESSIDSQGMLLREKAQSINKIGHALHDLNPVFDEFSRQPKLAQLVADLGILSPLLIQSMYIFKQPYIGGEVICHQDSTFVYLKGQPITGFWFALEDATVQNGCLWALPGGQNSPLKSRLLRDEKGGVRMQIYDESPWDLEKIIPLEVPRGSLIVLHGLLPHLSKANHSPHSRHAYSLHVGSGMAEYPKDNWLRRSAALPFRGFV